MSIDEIKAVVPDIDSYYEIVDGVRLPVKIYLNDSDVMVLAIHGGGWTAVKEDSDSWDGSWMNFQAQYYAKKGFNAAAISYRSIDFSDETDVFDLIDDCKKAVKFIREKCSFKKLVVMGDSAGGHLAFELAFDESMDVDIVVALNPVVDCTCEPWKKIAKTDAELKAASPLFNVKKLDTKFLFIHGYADTVVDYRTVLELHHKMKAVGNDSEFIGIDGAKHAFILQNYQSTDEEITKYMGIIDDYLRERKI